MPTPPELHCDTFSIRPAGYEVKFASEWPWECADPKAAAMAYFDGVIMRELRADALIQYLDGLKRVRRRRLER